MNEIKRVSPDISGVPDGLELESSGVVTDFLRRKMKQHKLPCSLKVSWITGVFSISFSDGGHRKMVSVRLDELCAILGEAAKVRAEIEKSMSEANATITNEEDDIDARKRT